MQPETYNIHTSLADILGKLLRTSGSSTKEIVIWGELCVYEIEIETKFNEAACTEFIQ
jgi:hypothetical protein